MKYDAIKSLPKGLVDDVAKFLKREHVEAKPLNEEVEQLDELSKGTLARYANRAINDIRNANQAKIRWQQKDGAKEYIFQNPKTGSYEKRTAKEMEDEHSRTARNREKGVRTAIKKLTKEDIDLEDFLVINEDLNVGIILEANEEFTEILFDEGVITLDTADIMFEEVEQLDELSKDTMLSYVAKAKADPAFEKKKGKPSKVTVAIRAKRESGIANAKQKLQAIVKAESEARVKEMQMLNSKLDRHFESEAPKILKKHGFELIHTGKMDVTSAEGDGEKHINTYIKKHDNGHVSVIALHKHPKNGFYRSSAHEAKALNTKGSSYSGHTAHHGVFDKKDYDKHVTEMMPNFEQHVIRVKNDGESASNW